MLPWTQVPSSQNHPAAVFGDVVVTVAGLTTGGWVVAASAAAGAAAGQLLWTTTLPLGTSLPTPVAVVGDLAVLALDSRIYALLPANGSLAWNASSQCSLGDPLLVNTL